MKLAEIEHEALALPDRDRASLAAKLLDTLPPPGTDVSDEEVERRDQELDSGQVTAISQEEFVRRVQRERQLASSNGKAKDLGCPDLPVLPLTRKD